MNPFTWKFAASIYQRRADLAKSTASHDSAIGTQQQAVIRLAPDAHGSGRDFFEHMEELKRAKEASEARKLAGVRLPTGAKWG